MIHKVCNGLHRIGDIFAFFTLRSPAADLQACVAVSATSLRVAVRHPVGKATICVRAFPPFTGLMGQISIGDKRFDHARMRMKTLRDLGTEGCTVVATIDIVSGHTVFEGI